MSPRFKQIDQAALARPGPAGLVERLKFLRQRDKLVQAEVAAAVDVDRATVTEWESGKKQPSRDKLLRLASFYFVSVDWLLNGSDEQHTPPARDEEEILRALRAAPEHVRQAVATLLLGSK